ncbi:hypothetical protein H8959_021619 [Pygathrix nigripes]
MGPVFQKTHQEPPTGDEPKLAFVIRIRCIDGMSPKVRKVLHLLCCRQTSVETL